VHKALEDLDFDHPTTPDVRALTDLDLGDDEVAEIEAFVAAFTDSPLRERLTAAPSVRREAWFAFALEPDGSGPLVRGIVDVLAIEPDGTHLVVDYKTDAVPAESTPEGYIARHYETQRLVYALAALRAGAPRVEIAYCLLERPAEPVTTTYTPHDAPELADRLQALAHGLMRHEYAVTSEPHRELCGDCPGRTALCSHPESVTLRPPPAPWPEAPDRRSSPTGAPLAAGPPPR
jgi:RecB family exonuclease